VAMHPHSRSLIRHTPLMIVSRVFLFFFCLSCVCSLYPLIRCGGLHAPCTALTTNAFTSPPFFFLASSLSPSLSQKPPRHGAGIAKNSGNGCVGASGNVCDEHEGHHAPLKATSTQGRPQPGASWIFVAVSFCNSREYHTPTPSSFLM
jgi:hypothetical protein